MLIWLPVSVGQSGLSQSYMPPDHTSARASGFPTSALQHHSTDEFPAETAEMTGKNVYFPGHCSSVNPVLIDFYMNHWLKGLLFLPSIKMP